MVRLFVTVMAGLSTGCLGEIETTESVRTLPYHLSLEELAALPPRPLTPPTARAVAGRVELGPIVGYYPLPIGLFVSDPAYNQASAWAPVTTSPTPEDALAGWLGRAIRPNETGPTRRVTGVVTHIEWSMLGIDANAGRIVSTLVVADERGAVRFSASRETAARVPFLDALLRAHVNDWLADRAFVEALGGMVTP
jgi:hypothetical protein